MLCLSHVLESRQGLVILVIGPVLLYLGTDEFYHYSVDMARIEVECNCTTKPYTCAWLQAHCCLHSVPNPAVDLDALSPFGLA